MAEERAVPCEAGRQKVEQVMREFKEGKLKSGSGKQVKGRQQALAIALSEGRRKCEES